MFVRQLVKQLKFATPSLRSVNRLGSPPTQSIARLRLFSVPSDVVKLTFIEPEGERVEVEAQVGQNILDIAQENDIELEGACGGSLACSTCHVILDEKFFATLPEATEDERDMLDMAIHLTDTSRLGCQLKVTPEWDGQVVRLPAGFQNLQPTGL